MENFKHSNVDFLNRIDLKASVKIAEMKAI